MTAPESPLSNRLLSATLLLALILSVGCLALMTAEYDESWILASGRQAFDATALPQVNPVLTTGGLHLLAAGLSTWLPGNPYWVVRAASLLSVLAMAVLVWRSLGLQFASRTERLIVLVTCLGAPGTVLMAGMGYGIAPAMFLLLLGLLIAVRKPRISVGDAALAGLCVGLAMATRWTVVPALPALLLIAGFSGDNRIHNFIFAVLACVLACAVFLLVSWGQVILLDGTGPTQGISMSNNAKAAGISAGLPHPARVLAFLTRLAATLPVSLLIVAVLALFALREDAQQRRIILVLLGAAALILAAWILRAPWMHMRYVWPVYLLISLCAGLGLAALYRAVAGKAPVLTAFAVGLPITLALAQSALALRLIAVGAGMQVNNGGYDNQENHYKPLHLFQEQRAITRYLRDLPAEARVAAFGLPNEQGALELTLLSGRPVVDITIRHHGEPAPPDYVIAHRFSPVNLAGQAWLDELGAPVAQVAGYRIYAAPPGTALPDPDGLMLDPQIYRFSLEKWQSLTGW